MCRIVENSGEDSHGLDRTLLSGSGSPLQAGDRAESCTKPVAIDSADADGVHVGQDEIPVADARQIVGPSRLIGLSTHSIEQAREAVALGADYLGCGPVFPGRTKEFDAYVGAELLREVADEIELPAFAIGGIDATNLHHVMDAGVNRIAVTGAVRDAADPGQAAIALKEQLMR